MKAQKDIFSGTRTRLTRHDLIAYEQLLADGVSRFLSFKSYSVYFPRSVQATEPFWDSADRKLLLPLLLRGEMLGVFVARGVKLRSQKRLFAMLPAMAELVMEKLLLYKMSITDPTTGLFSRPYLQQTMCREVTRIRNCFIPTADSDCELAATGHRACMGVVTFQLASLRKVVREYGYIFADHVAEKLADTLCECAPEQAIAARTGDFEFAVFLPSGTLGSCKKFAKSAVHALRGIRVVHDLTEDSVGVAACAGYAAYPQDMEGATFERPEQEQARLLLRKSRIAAGIAGEANAGEALDYVMGFNRILTEGGKVLETMPMNRSRVSLGRSMGAKEGQRFSVWSVQYDLQKQADANGNGDSPTPMYKGEIVLMEVQETTALAEVMHLGDPTWSIEPGDRITLLPEDKGISASQGEEGRVDPLTGLLRHRDFLARFSKEREKFDTFALALLRLTGKDRSHESRYSHPEQLMAEAAEVCRDILGSELIGGRYGLNSLMYFHAAEKSEALHERYTLLCTELDRTLHIEAAVGISCYPFLHYRKADGLENSLKALEYAMLLDKPRVGIMDSLALNISADKLYSRGDTFAAIEEYKRALLADESNVMAWNSLGVCYAGLGKAQEAREQFKEALKYNRNNVMALYNMGHICQTLGKVEEARRHYRKCLRQEKNHLFSLIRLGQLAEQEKKFGAARQYYNKAARQEENQALVCRHLARLCMRQGRPDEAREHLHQALLYNPQDAIALQLMARLYLDGGEDPEVAEVLARQAAALSPQYKAAWLELARALEARGNMAEASAALCKAGEL